MPTENGQSMDTPSATCVKQALLWQIFIHLLTERGEATDAAVQLTVTNAIKSCVDVSIISDFTMSTHFCSYGM